MADNDLILNQIDLSALVRLKDDLANSYEDIDTNIEKAGAIKFFEMAYELSWKTIKKVLLAHHGIEAKAGPKNIFREAARVGYIEDPEIWFSFVETRNETVHAYDEGTADDVVSKLPDFIRELGKLIDKLKTIE